MPRVDAPTFTSPLRVSGADPFPSLQFGLPPRDSAIEALHRAMNDDLAQLTAEALPPRLATEARDLLGQYAAGDFFSLFPVPAWSFLHWLPAGGTVPPAIAARARRAHALALFLHLWDDHLCDGELAPDLLRLQLRTAAWQRWETDCRVLTRSLGADTTLWSRHAARYLDALHRPAPAPDLPAYEAAFRESVALWTVVPLLLAGTAPEPDGPAAARSLQTTLEAFFVAWRLLDDLQDVRADSQAGRTTAVTLLLSPSSRTHWSACRESQAAFPVVIGDLAAARLPARLLWRIAALLGEARTAAASRWPAIAEEIAHAALGPAAADIGSAGPAYQPPVAGAVTAAPGAAGSSALGGLGSPPRSPC